MLRRGDVPGSGRVGCIGTDIDPCETEDEDKGIGESSLGCVHTCFLKMSPGAIAKGFYDNLRDSHLHLRAVQVSPLRGSE